MRIAVVEQDPPSVVAGIDVGLRSGARRARRIAGRRASALACASSDEVALEGERTMRRSVLGAVAAIAVVLSGLSAAPALAAGSATTAGGSGVAAFAASSRYLVYGEGALRSEDGPAPGALLWRTATGRSHRLAASRDLNEAQASIAGSMVVYRADAASAGTLRWRDLATGAHGSFAEQQTLTLADGTSARATYRAPAPHGWIREAATPGADHLLLQTPTGFTDLGAPEPGGDSLDEHGIRDLDDHLQVRTSSTTLVVTASADETYSNGSASVMSFAAPGLYRRVIGLGHSPACQSVSSRFVACSVYDVPASRQRLYSAAGRLVTSSKLAGEAYVVGSALGVVSQTARHGIHRFTLIRADGRARDVEAAISTRGQSGLGGLIVTTGRASWGARHLAVLSSSGRLRTLAR